VNPEGFRRAMPFFGRRPVARAAAVRPLPPVARRAQSPRFHRPVAQPPSPESKPGLSVHRPRCLSAPHRLPGGGVAQSLPSVARRPLPRRSPGLPVARPRRLLDAVHADPVNRVLVDAAGLPPSSQLGCSLGLRPVTSPPVAPGCPATRYFEACGFSLRPEPLSPRGSGPFSVPSVPKD
jgi:hypothetical protein